MTEGCYFGNRQRVNLSDCEKIVNREDGRVERRARVIGALIEGNSIRSTVRMTGVMEAGLADHFWSLEELVGLLERKAEGAAA
jgi:hypothetical protein